MKFLLICGVIASWQTDLHAQADEVDQAEADKAAEVMKEANPVLTEFDRLFPEKQFYTREEVLALRRVLESKSSKLDQAIESERAYVESLKKQVEEHLAKISSARDQIADFMNERDAKEEGKLKKLARFYEAMEAEQAAPLFTNIQDELAIKIFDRMDTKKAGGILALIPANRAARITANFPKLRLQADGG